VCGDEAGDRGADDLRPGQVDVPGGQRRSSARQAAQGHREVEELVRGVPG
jgi:hypothetical protein